MAIDWDLAGEGIYRITDQIFVGQYPKSESFGRLKDLGIGTILNVSGGHYAQDGFTVVNIPVVDLVELPLPAADQIVDTITRTVRQGGRLYVHCIAGQNRSPGAVFLGLLALGISEPEAVRLIESSTLDAVAKHQKIISDRVVRHVLARPCG